MARGLPDGSSLVGPSSEHSPSDESLKDDLLDLTAGLFVGGTNGAGGRGGMFLEDADDDAVDLFLFRDWEDGVVPSTFESSSGALVTVADTC